jgi:hypothetical protein
MNALVKLVDVSKSYAKATVLHSTNLSVERGKDHRSHWAKRLWQIDIAPIDYSVD